MRMLAYYSRQALTKPYKPRVVSDIMECSIDGSQSTHSGKSRGPSAATF